MKRLSLSLVSCMLLGAFAGCGGGNGGGNNSGITSLDNNNSDADLINRNIRTLSEPLHEVLKASTVKIKVGDTGWGSGFFVGEGGYIVTNNHVVAGEGELRVDIFGEDRLINAEKIAYAECADLAVIRLTQSTMLPPSPDNQNSLTWLDYRVEPTLTIGSAGFPSTVRDNKREPVYTYTEGSVQTEPRQVDTSWASTEAFNHGALIATGNSGGPLVEVSTGKVVGVNYAGNNKEHRQLAISGLMAKDYVNRMIQGENIHSIGIKPKVYLDDENYSTGVVAGAVVPGKHADRIGIKAGDHIIALGGEYLWALNGMNDEQLYRISTLDKYCSMLRSQNPNNKKDKINDKGATIAITIARHAKEGGVVICSGQINGKSLTLKDDENIICPDAAKFNYKSNRSLNVQIMKKINLEFN